MSDESQITVPESFVALYRDRYQRLTIRAQELAARSELCEDLAQAMTERCREIHFRDGVDEAEVLARCLQGLLHDGSPITPPEARWVVCRTAELLGWDWSSIAPQG